MRAGKIVRDRMASQVSICKPGLFGFDTPELPCRDTAVPIGVNLSLKPLRNMGFMPSLDPPRIPLVVGGL